MNSRPKRLGCTKILEEHGKVVFREIFEGPWGKLTEWLLFGSTKVPVVVFPLDENDHVIALRHFRYGAGEEVWELPGGSIEGNQTPKEAVRKELQQEARHTVRKKYIRELLRIRSVSLGIWFD